MNISQGGKIAMIVSFCLGIGFIFGQINMERAINLDGMKEVHLFGVHTSYLRGCVEGHPDATWESCVRGAQNATKDVRDILEQEPQLLHNLPEGIDPVPVIKEDHGTTKPQDLEKLLKHRKPILI